MGQQAGAHDATPLHPSLSRARLTCALPPSTGENFELRADLNSEYRDKRADAIKRVIANMTVGKDVSGLFPDGEPDLEAGREGGLA